jgi:hypothetical protein
VKQFKYVGPYDEVEVNHIGLVKQGETVQVEDPEVSAGLEGQDVWEHVPDKQRSKAAKKAAETRAAASEDEPAGDEPAASDDSQEG